MVGLGTVALTLAVSAPAGYALSKLFVPGRRVISFVLLVAQMIPAVVMALGFYTIYSRLGILDTIPGLILADSTLAVPFGVMVFTAFMSGIPRELLQAAEVDGASYWRTFWSVVLPVTRNSAVTVATVRVPVGLVGLPVRLHPRPRRPKPSPDHAWASTTTSAPRTRTGDR